MVFIEKLTQIENRIQNIFTHGSSVMFGVSNGRGGEIIVNNGLQDGDGRIEVYLGGVPPSDFDVQLNTEYTTYMVNNFSSRFDTDKGLSVRHLHITVDTDEESWIFHCSPACIFKASYTGLEFTPRKIWSVDSVQFDRSKENVVSVTIYVNGSESLRFLSNAGAENRW